MSSEIGGPLHFVVTEILFPYDPAERAEWQAGKLLDSLLPKSERPRIPDKYKIQYKDNHYGEVLAMNALLADGWSWFYENYYTFPHRYTKRWLDHCKWLETSQGYAYAPGTRQLTDLLGKDVMRRLWKAAEMYSPSDNSDEKAKEPDLLAYRMNNSELEIRAVEVKLETDTLNKRGQLLGLAILQTVLGCDIEIRNYRAEPGRHRSRKHDEMFRPL